ncbi:MAG: hypothetical protein V3U76_04315 [Granulosicoccus sp.]
MVVRRIKDRWHNSTPKDTERDILIEKTMQDQASALSFIIWRLALNGAINLHAEDFRYDDDRQRIGVISEFLAFQIQHIDRLGHACLEIDERKSLLEALCGRVADLMQDNLTDIAGPGDYRPPFIALLNTRFAEYAQCKYDAGQPGFDALRYFGSSVLQIMGEDQTNRWVIDQIIAIDAQELVEQTTKSFNRLFGHEEKLS